MHECRSMQNYDAAPLSVGSVREDHSLLKREVIDLITQQIEALRKATFLSMTAEEMEGLRKSARRLFCVLLQPATVR